MYISSLFNRQLKNSAVTRITGAALFSFSLTLGFSSALYAEVPAAGRVSLVIGTAYAEGPSRDKRQKVTSGMPVYEKDRLITSSGGHVHIRFIDNGLISLRPDSLVEIAHYEYNASYPEQSTIKFNLEEGIARSVSGNGAKAARHRFRMNTPIAAIGVRGTDFVVSAGKEDVRAIVNEGIIVVAPFSDQCSASSLGPCNLNAVELTGISRQALEFNALLDKPRLIPLNSPDIPEFLNSSGNGSTPPASEPAEKGSVENESIEDSQSSVSTHESMSSDPGGDSARSITSNLPDVDADQTGSLPDEGASDIITDNISTPEDVSETLTEELSDNLSEVIDFTPEGKLDTHTLKRRQLAWGRWGNAQPEDAYMLSRKEISSHKVTVGNAEYGLFRLDTGTSTLQPNLGQVSLNLLYAQVYFTGDNAVQEAMRVEDGWLNIDFDQQTFDTGLKLDHASTDDVEFAVQGTVNDRGFLKHSSGQSSLGGAVSLDSKEAGYFFEHQLENGSIKGTTLWERPVP